MKWKLDFQTTSHKTKCHLCKRNIVKGKMRFCIDNNSSYQKVQHYYHLECFEEKLEQFKKQVPINKLEG